jgi:transposase
MALTNGDGVPISICMADGSRHDSALVEQTLDAAFTQEVPSKMIADKAFDSAPLEAMLNERGIELICPQRINTKSRTQDGRALRRYKRRWKVERLFAWLKRSRRIATRWDRHAENYLGFLHLACIRILLRQKSVLSA